MRLLYGNRFFLCVMELVGCGFDMLAELAGAVDDSGDEVDPALGEVVAARPLGVGVDAIGVPQGDRVDGELLMKRRGVVGARGNDIEPVDEAGSNFG